MNNYKAVKGLGDTITCDNCTDIAEDWFSDGTHAICGDCYNEKPMSWSEVAELTHVTQVEQFNWCGCEEQEYFPYADCPRLCEICESNEKENPEGKWCASCKDDYKGSDNE